MLTTQKAIIMSEGLSPRYQRRLQKLGLKPIAGKPPRLAFVRKELIGIDPSYQRKIVERKVIEYASDFDWSAFGAISVSLRPDGSYFATDGQERLHAANLRPEIDEIPCAIHEMTSVEEEARSCIKINARSTTFQQIEQFKAKVTAKEPLALKIQKFIDDHGVIIKPHRDHARGWDALQCIQAIYNFWGGNENAAMNAFEVSLALAKKVNNPVTSYIFKALFFIHEREIIRVSCPEVRVNLCNPEIQNWLMRHDHGKILRAIKGKHEGSKIGSGSAHPKKLAEGILDMLNRYPSTGYSIPQKNFWEFAPPRGRGAKQ
jgi:hypothetical protein